MLTGISRGKYRNIQSNGDFIVVLSAFACFAVYKILLGIVDGINNNNNSNLKRNSSHKFNKMSQYVGSFWQWLARLARNNL